MANEHPFQLLFESFGRLPTAHAETVNRKAYEALTDVLTSPVEAPGRFILLRAPRAGHGKTHLLSRVQHHLGGTHEFIPLHASGSRVDALSVTEDALKRLTRSLPAANGLTVLDLVVRRLFAFALQPLVVSGEVPCQDREGALAALKARPVETFDFHHPNAVTAHWARENFEVLGPRLSMELSQRSGVAIREVSFWVNAFFRYAATPIDHPGRTGALGLEVAGEAITEGVAMERLLALLAMLSLLMRVVLVADDLEGFSADETAALKFAAFVGAIRQSVDRVDIILSLNKDIWETAFLPRLSGGLADRLSEVLIELEPLTDEDIVALFESRAPGLGQQVLDRVDVSERHARGLIRAAGEAWISAANDKTEPVVAAPTPPPVMVVEPEPEPEEEPELAAAAEIPETPVEEKPSVIHFPSAEPPPQPDFVAQAAVQQRPFGTQGGNGLDARVFEDLDEIFDPGPVKEQPVSWAAGAVYEAQLVDEPAKPEPFAPAAQTFEAPSSPSPFQPVYSENHPPRFTPPPSPSPQFARPEESVFQFQPPAAPPYSPPQFNPPPPEYATPFQPVESVPPPAFVPVGQPAAGHSPYGTPHYEVARPPAGYATPQYSPPPAAPAEPAKAPEIEGDRVDDLLKQFRERYGRGGL